MPDCDNYGIPAHHEYSKSSSAPDRDRNYVIHSIKGGQVRTLSCKSCKDRPPLRSNASIAAELERVTELSGLHTREELVGCRNPECENHGRPIAYNRSCYHKRGRAQPDSQSYRCKACGRTVLVSDPVRLHEKNRTLAVDTFRWIINKGALRRTIDGAQLNGAMDYYKILRFIHARCRTFSGRFDRALIDGRLKLPRRMNLESDAQTYTLNWISRLDRRNAELHAYCTVDSKSRFVFGMHTNFDHRVDPFEINTKAAAKGEMQVLEPFREHAQYWLVGDELGAGRGLGSNMEGRRDLIERIQGLYAQADTRKDVENIELQHLDTTLVTPTLKGGLQVHLAYTTYAHWFLLHRILTGGGVEKFQVNIDVDSMSRAAFLCAFMDEVKRGDADLFYVLFTKNLPVDERRRIKNEAKRAARAFAKTLPPEGRDTSWKVSRAMMQESLKHGLKIGRWSDDWFRHPIATSNEPEKLVSWMTPRDTVSEDRKADMYLRAGLPRVDTTFAKTRRLINAFERKLDTGAERALWSGYAAYNPEMVQTYLTVFRTCNNFVILGDDDKTPAMRLGLTKQPLDLEDILWAGQRVPRPKRVRRRGRKIPV